MICSEWLVLHMCCVFWGLWFWPSAAKQMQPTVHKFTNVHIPTSSVQLSTYLWGCILLEGHWIESSQVFLFITLRGGLGCRGNLGRLSGCGFLCFQWKHKVRLCLYSSLTVKFLLTDNIYFIARFFLQKHITIQHTHKVLTYFVSVNIAV